MGGICLIGPDPAANTSDRYRTLIRLPAYLDRGPAFVTARSQHLPSVVASAACCWGSRLFQTPDATSPRDAPNVAAGTGIAPSRSLSRSSGLVCFDPGLQAFV